MGATCPGPRLEAGKGNKKNCACGGTCKKDHHRPIKREELNEKILAEIKEKGRLATTCPRCGGGLEKIQCIEEKEPIAVGKKRCEPCGVVWQLDHIGGQQPWLLYAFVATCYCRGERFKEQI